jgi:uncharacterized membrane protein YhaH (DUF805 family)
MIRVAQRPGWWLLLLFIPFVNFIVLLVVTVDVAKAFGKGPLFALGLILLPFIFYPMIAFSGGIEYVGREGAEVSGGVPA